MPEPPPEREWQYTEEDPFPPSSPYIDQYDIEAEIYGFFREPNPLFTKKGRPFKVHHDKDADEDMRALAWRSRHRKIWPLVSQIFHVKEEAGMKNLFIAGLQPEFEASGLPR